MNHPSNTNEACENEPRGYENDEEKVEWEKVNVDDLPEEDLTFQKLPRSEKEEPKEPIKALNSIAEENLIPMNINTLFAQDKDKEDDECNIVNELEKDKYMTEDFNIDQEIEKMRRNFSDNSTSLNFNNNNNYNSTGETNANVKETVNLKPFYVKDKEEDDDQEEELDMPSLFADLTLFNKTLSTPNKKKVNMFEDLTNQQNNHKIGFPSHINIEDDDDNVFSKNIHFNVFSNSSNNVTNSNMHLNSNNMHSMPVINNNSEYINNINQQMSYNNNLQMINNRSEVEGKVYQSLTPNNKRSMNKFNIAANVSKGGINTNDSFLSSTPVTFNNPRTPNNINSNMLYSHINTNNINNNTNSSNDVTHSSNQQPINYRKINNLENPINLIMKNLNMKGWRISDTDSTNVRLFNSFELFSFLENEIKEGRNISTYCINDYEIDVHFIPNFLYECLKENIPALREKMMSSIRQTFTNTNPVQMRRNYSNKYSAMEGLSSPTQQQQNTINSNTINSNTNQPLVMNKGFSHDSTMHGQSNLHMNKFNNLPQFRNNNRVNTNPNLVNSNDPNMFPKSNNIINNNINFINNNNYMQCHNNVSPNKGNIYNQPNTNNNNQTNYSQVPYNINPLFHSISPSNVNSTGTMPIRPMNFNFNVNFVNNELSLNSIIMNSEENSKQINFPLFSPEGSKSPNNYDFGENDMIPDCIRQIEKSTPLKNMKNKYTATYEKSKIGNTIGDK